MAYYINIFKCADGTLDRYVDRDVPNLPTGRLYDGSWRYPISANCYACQCRLERALYRDVIRAIDPDNSEAPVPAFWEGFYHLPNRHQKRHVAVNRLADYLDLQSQYRTRLYERGDYLD